MIAAEEASQRWQPFLKAFFNAPNSLSGPTGGATELDAIIAAAASALSGESPLPVILPARVGDRTEYFGIAFDRDQSRSLRELLTSFVGSTWTDFDGRSLASAHQLDVLDRAAIELAGGDPALVYRFRVAQSARAQVRVAVRSLMILVATRPQREVGMSQPLGRLLGDFEDACASGAEQAARDAYERLASDHRVSATNRLFLRVQMLAAIEGWEELATMPGLSEMLRVPRPALAADALARLSLIRLETPVTLADFGPVAEDFGALVPSVGSIRSVIGARYYALWCLYTGEDPTPLRARLETAGWGFEGHLLAIPTAAPSSTPSATPRESSGTTDKAVASREQLGAALLSAMESDRLDAAVDILAKLPAAAENLLTVISLVRRTLTAEAVALLNQYRLTLGQDVVDLALAHNRSPSDTSLDTLDTQVALSDRVRSVLQRDVEPIVRAKHRLAVAQTGLSELVVPGMVESVTSEIQMVVSLASAAIDLELGFDVCVDLARDLARSEVPSSGLAALGAALLELWAFHDESGDRRRVRRVVQLADDSLQAGVSSIGFDELVEMLRAGWSPFLTDADLPTGLDAIEILLGYRPEGSTALDAFAAPILTRIGPHNSRRVSPAALAVAVELAQLLGTPIVAHSDPIESTDSDLARREHPPGTVVALYSLMEQAAERTANILKRRHPGIDVVVLADHVASDRLRHAARTADLVVVMDRAAKHSATEALRAARGSKPIRFAAGKGSTSLLEATESGLADLLSAGAR